MDVAFRGPNQGKLLTRESTLRRTDVYIYFFPMFLNFLTNSRLNISVLKIGLKFKTVSVNKKFIGFLTKNKIFVTAVYLMFSRNYLIAEQMCINII